MAWIARRLRSASGITLRPPNEIVERDTHAWQEGPAEAAAAHANQLARGTIQRLRVKGPGASPPRTLIRDPAGEVVGQSCRALSASFLVAKGIPVVETCRVTLPRPGRWQ
jgi:hypothetical protein